MKGRFKYISKMCKNIHSGPEEIKKLDDETIDADNYTQVNNFEQNYDKLQENPSFPSLDDKNSNKFPYVNGLSRKSFTEFSLSNNRDQFSYQPNRNELRRTPVFTMDPNQYSSKPIPPLSFERVNKYNELQSKEEEKTLDEPFNLSSKERNNIPEIHNMSNRPERGSCTQFVNQRMNPAMGYENIPNYQNYPIRTMPRASAEMFPRHDSTREVMDFAAQSFKTMLESQNSQFGYMMD